MRRMWAGKVGGVPGGIIESANGLAAVGRSIMIIRQGERWLGVLGLADKPRVGVRAALEAIRAMGVERIVMLTGDNAGIGAVIGREVGVDEVQSELMPEEKVSAVHKLVREYGRVAMVGDGVNDARRWRRQRWVLRWVEQEQRQRWKRRMPR